MAHFEEKDLELEKLVFAFNDVKNGYKKNLMCVFNESVKKADETALASYEKMTSEVANIARTVKEAKKSGKKVSLEMVNAWKKTMEKITAEAQKVEFTANSIDTDGLNRNGLRLARLMKGRIDEYSMSADENGLCDVAKIENEKADKFKEYEKKEAEELEEEKRVAVQRAEEAKKRAEEEKKRAEEARKRAEAEQKANAEHTITNRTKDLIRLSTALANTNKGFTKQSNQFRDFRKSVDKLCKTLIMNKGCVTREGADMIAHLTDDIQKCADKYYTHHRKHLDDYNAVRKSRLDLVDEVLKSVKEINKLPRVSAARKRWGLDDEHAVLANSAKVAESSVDAAKGNISADRFMQSFM